MPEISLDEISRWNQPKEIYAAKRTELTDIVGKSKQEVECLIAPLVASKPKEKIRALKVKERPELSPVIVPEERFEIKFSVDKETYREIQDLMNELSNALGEKPSVESVMKRLLREHREKKQRAERLSVTTWGSSVRDTTSILRSKNSAEGLLTVPDDQDGESL